MSTKAWLKGMCIRSVSNPKPRGDPENAQKTCFLTVFGCILINALPDYKGIRPENPVRSPAAIF